MNTIETESAFISELLEKVKNGLVTHDMANDLLEFEMDRGVSNYALFSDAQKSLDVNEKSLASIEKEKKKARI